MEPQKKIHCFSPTSQRDTTECHIQSSPHTMSAPVTPLEEGIFGVGHITQACCNLTPSQLPMIKKSQFGRDPFTFTLGHRLLHFIVQLLTEACRCNIRSATSLIQSVVTTYTCKIYPHSKSLKIRNRTDIDHLDNVSLE